MAVSIRSLLVFSLFLLHQLISSTANIHKTKLFRSELISQATSSNDAPLTTYFEVTKPIKLPRTKPCSYLILQHDFGYTYGKPPVLANYSPPSNCPSHNFAKIVLEWKAISKGRQFDRIFGVWLGGVELLRSCTAEPRATGTVWTVKKDITRYYSLLMTNQTLAVYLGNIVDSTYTGVYHVNITVHFYPPELHYTSYEPNSDDSINGYVSGADLILPISRNLPLKDGLWFEIENSTDIESKEFKIPQNAYRAVLEVYVSFHENDEFWFANFPNEYIAANNLTDTPGNGPFREVVVNLDGIVVGAIWPFTVIYTGGVNPLLWRPITGIGSFDLPSYDIEITPFLGTILDGKTHEFAFSVTNALNVWYIDANLHVWLDKKNQKNEGKLLEHTCLPLAVSLVSNFTGPNGTFLTGVSRSISSAGWVKSSYGTITTNSIQEFNFSNFMVLGNDGNLQLVNQIINFNDSVSAKMLNSYIHSTKSFKRFPFYLYSDTVDRGNGTYASLANLTLGYNEDRVKTAAFGSFISSLKNLQNGQGYMLVKDHLVVSGLGSTQQLYRYDGSKFCYFRNVSSSNYTILYDKVNSTCTKRRHSHLGFGLAKWWSPAAPMPTGSQMQPKTGSHKLTSASRANLTPVDSRKQLGHNNGIGPGRPLGPKSLPFKTPATTIEKKVSAPIAKSSMPGVHKQPYSKLHTSVPKKPLEHRKEIQESSKAKLIPKQPVSSAKPQINKPPAKPPSRATFQEDRPKKKPVRQYSDEDRPKKKPVRQYSDDDDDDGGRAINMIRRMFGYNPNKFTGYDDDDSDMEANFDDIMREEKRSAKIAKKEDEEELRKIEEEERREWLRKEAKKRKLSQR